jgi:hypothetical protein
VVTAGSPARRDGTAAVIMPSPPTRPDLLGEQDIHKRKAPAVTTDGTPTSPRPGSDAGINDLHADTGQTKKLGDIVDALPGTADVQAEVEQKVTDTTDRITDTANETKDAAVETVGAVGSATRGLLNNVKGSLKPGVPIAALIASAVAISVVVWRRR